MIFKNKDSAGADREILAQIQRELHEANSLRRELIAIFKQRDILITSEAPFEQPEDSLRSIEEIFAERGVDRWECRLKVDKDIQPEMVGCKWIFEKFGISQKDQRYFAKKNGYREHFRTTDKKHYNPLWDRADAIMMIRYFDSQKHK